MIKCVGCIIYDVSKDMVLLQQRSKTSSHPLKWGLWGGKLNKGEDFANGLRREIQEELGNTPEFIKLYPLDTFLSDDNEFIYYSFIMIVDDFNDIIINDSETNDFVWLPFKYITRLDLHPDLNRTLETKEELIENVIRKHKDGK